MFHSKKKRWARSCLSLTAMTKDTLSCSLPNTDLTQKSSGSPWQGRWVIPHDPTSKATGSSTTRFPVALNTRCNVSEVESAGLCQCLLVAQKCTDAYKKNIDQSGDRKGRLRCLVYHLHTITNLTIFLPTIYIACSKFPTSYITSKSVSSHKITK